MFDREAYNKRIEWFKEARFGMFIHWGLYSIPARGEWVRSTEQMSIEDYQEYFDEFNPVDYNPKEWARMAKEAGMKYVVLTAKHHDGFCLFDSQYTEYKATNTKAGRDLIREYVDAVRAEGLKVGLYYSIIDWHHPDFPHYGDRQHPMRNNEAYKDVVHNFDNYLDYMHKQVRELCTNYGQIDLLWSDFSYDHLRGEAWRATELVNMIRELQPNVIMDNRLEVSGEGYGSLATNNPQVYSGDFVSPEQIIPLEGIRDEAGRPVMWEACITMNNNWGYNERDKFFKSPDMIVKKLVECVSKGGNMILNIGPDAKGNVPQESVDVLRRVGKWMKGNHLSIYGCDNSGMDKPEYGRITRNGNKIYYHVMENPIGFVALHGLKKEDIKKIRLLATGTELKIADSWVTSNYPDVVFVSFGPNPQMPDDIDTVIEVELK